MMCGTNQPTLESNGSPSIVGKSLDLRLPSLLRFVVRCMTLMVNKAKQLRRCAKDKYRVKRSPVSGFGCDGNKVRLH